MTKEEAIRELKVKYLGDTDEIRQAKDMAISALSGNKGDTVSRVVYEQIKWERDIAIQQLKDLGYFLGEKPKESRGEWIPVVDSYYEDGTIKENHWECSRCGSGRSGWGEFKFCPDCGADMRQSKRKPKGEKGET